MKLTKLRDEILKFMVKTYYETENKAFSFEELQDQFPEQSESLIEDACRLLIQDKLITANWSDDLPDDIELQVRAIAIRDDDTWLKKGYAIIKELRQWI